MRLAWPPKGVNVKDWGLGDQRSGCGRFLEVRIFNFAGIRRFCLFGTEFSLLISEEKRSKVWVGFEVHKTAVC